MRTRSQPYNHVHDKALISNQTYVLLRVMEEIEIIGSKFRTDRLYWIQTGEHLWFLNTAPDQLLVGVNDFFQAEMGSIKHLLLRGEGKPVKEGGLLCKIHSADYALTLHSPFAATIIRRNNALFTSPALVNESPYDDGWLFEIKAEPSQLEGLLGNGHVTAATEPKLEEFIKSEKAGNAIANADCCPKVTESSGVVRRKAK